ncbi:unnamed protein product [Discosporangium mesarthrocarpum]
MHFNFSLCSILTIRSFQYLYFKCLLWIRVRVSICLFCIRTLRACSNLNVPYQHHFPGCRFLLSDPVLRDLFAADYCVTELGGATIPDIKMRPTMQYFQTTAEKGTWHVNVTQIGRPGHGSVPLSADNALTWGASAVHHISRYLAPTVITPEWKAFVAALGLPFPLGQLLSLAATANLIIRLLLWLKSPLGPVAHALTRMTLSPNACHGAVKHNVIPGQCTVIVDVRTLPGQGEDDILRTIQVALGMGNNAPDKEGRYSLHIRSFTPATRSEPGTPLWRAMEISAKAIVPGASLVPVMLPGATDCRFFRTLGGAVAYGGNLLDPSVMFGELTKRFHGANERIELRSLWTSLQFYTLVVKNLMVVD